MSWPLFCDVEMGTTVVNGRTCESQSHKFVGPCVRKANCGNVCQTEGFHGGVCRGSLIHRKCYCTKNCWTPQPVHQYHCNGLGSGVGDCHPETAKNNIDDRWVECRIITSCFDCIFNVVFLRIMQLLFCEIVWFNSWINVLLNVADMIPIPTIPTIFSLEDRRDHN